MKFKEQVINKCTKKFTVDVAADAIREGYDVYYKRIQPKAAVPGFRKGKAPRQLLERYYADEAKEQVMRDLVAGSYEKLIQETGINPFGMPAISDLSFDDTALRFAATVEMRPEVELKKYKGLKVKKNTVTVEAKEVDDTIERLRAAYATYKTVEDRPVQKGDYIVVDSKCDVEGTVIEDRTDEGIELDEQHLLPEYVKNVVGTARGSSCQFTIKFPDTIPQEQYRGKKGDFTLTVKEIKEKVLPPLDEKFLKMAGEYETLDAFKDAIKKDIQKQKEQTEENRIERELLDFLCKDNTFDMPQSLIDERTAKLLEDTKKQMTSRGYGEADITKEEEKLKKECATEAKRQVKVAFILDKIAELENISVTEEDLSGKFYEFSRRYRQPVDTVREYYEKNDMLDTLRAELRNEKAIDIVKKETVQ